MHETPNQLDNDIVKILRRRVGDALLGFGFAAGAANPASRRSDTLVRPGRDDMTLIAG